MSSVLVWAWEGVAILLWATGLMVAIARVTKRGLVRITGAPGECSKIGAVLMFAGLLAVGYGIDFLPRSMWFPAMGAVLLASVATLHLVDPVQVENPAGGAEA